MRPGQNLISDSENAEKTKTRTVSFDPFAGRNRSFNTDSSFLKSARDLVTNTAFNFADSVLLGAPGAYLNSNMEGGRRDFYGRREASSYGDTFDSLGIKPFQELSGAGKFGYGLGQAAGFFVPYGALSKISKMGQRLAFGNINKMLDMSVDSGLTGLSTGSAMKNALSGSIKGSLKGKLGNLGNTVKSANPRDIEVFKTNMNSNLQKSIAEFFQREGQRVDARQIQAASKRITDSLVKNASPVRDAAGRLSHAGHIDNLEDLVGSAGIRVGDNRITRNLAGYVGRSIDQSVNFYMYDNLTRLSRATAGDGTEINGEDIDFDQLQIAKDSAFFASLLQLADFIPGGRKAGMAQDLKRFTVAALNKSRRSFKDLYDSGKMNEKQLRSTASFFSKFGSGPKGNNARNLQANRMNANELVKWLDDTYSKNKKELLSGILRDSGKSFIGSLPRAVVDGAATMVYMNGKDNFISPLADESMLADFLVGGFMAMRAYKPIDPRGKNIMGGDGLRWRYNTSLDAKFNLMENMGMDVSNIKNQVNAMDTLMRDIDFESRNYENSEKAMGLYNLLFNNNDTEDFKPDPDNNEPSSDYMQQKAIADSLMKVLSPVMLKKKSTETGKDVTAEDVDNMYESGEMPHVYSMSKQQFERFWNKIKDYEIKEGKTVDSYSEKGFDFLLEDLNDGIVKNHEDVLLRSVNQFAEAMDIKASDTLQDENGRIILKDYSFDSTQASDEVMFFHQRIKELEELGRVLIQKTGNTQDITNSLNSREGRNKIEAVSENLKRESSEFLDSTFEFSNYENPISNLVSNHAYLKAKNRITDALMNRARPDDPKFNEVRERINTVLGDTMGRNGIEVFGKNEDSFRESDRDEAAEDLINKLTNLKRAAGKSNANVEKKRVHINDVRGLFDYLNNEKIIGVKDNRIDSIAGMKYESFNKAIQDNIIMTSGLDTRDYVVYSVLSQNFGTTNEGKIKLPTRELAEQILENQEIQDQYKGNELAIVAGGKNSEKVKKALSRYQEIVNRLSRTGKIEFVDTMEFDVSPSRDFEDTVNMADKINLVHQIYNEQLSMETYDLSDKYDKANKKVSEARASMIRTKNKYERARTNNADEETMDKFLREYKESLSKLREGLDDIKALDGNENFFTPIDRIIEQQNKVSGEILSELFRENIVEATRDFEDFSLEVAKLANLNSARGAFSAANMQLRAEIIRKSEELGLQFSRTDINSNSLENVIDDFLIARDEGSFPEGQTPTSIMKNLVSSVNKSLNSLKSTNEADYNSKLNASDLLDFFNKSPISKAQENSQSFLNRVKRLGLNQFLDIDNGKLSGEFIKRINDNDRVVEAIQEVQDAVKKATGRNYEKEKESLHKEIISVIQSYGVRQYSQESLSIQANTLVYDDSRVGVRTPLTRFNEQMASKNIDLITIKDTYIDENGIKQTLSSTDDPQSALNAISKKVYSQASRNDITTQTQKVNDFLYKKLEGDNRVLIALQASEDIGVTFDRTRKNVKNLIDVFEDFRMKMENEAPSKEAARMLKEHFDAITMDLNRDALREGELEKASHASIGAAIRAMYYRNRISKDLFWRMIGEDTDSAMAEQAKSFKYIHHVNSKNAVGYESDVISRVAKAIETLDTFNTDEANVARRELVRRAQDGLRIMVLEDEIKGPDGKIMKNLSAEQVMEDTIRKVIKEKNLNYTEQQIKQIVEDSAYDADREVESVEQGLFDGVTFARKEAMVADAFIMGESFEAGTTAMKAQFHNADADVSLIGKTAVRHTKSMQKFMEDAEIDYLIPASSAKSWDNKKDVDTFNTNYDTSKSIGENLSKNIDGKKVNANSVKTFKTETLKYMFPAHHRNHQGNTNTSVTHHMTPEAIADYNRSLAIEELATAFKREAQTEHISGIMALFKQNWEHNENEFTALSAAEQLYEFGLTVQDSLIRSTIFRAAKDQFMNNIVAKKTPTVSNNFLFSNSALKSPTYGQTRTNPHVKSFGEIRLQHGVRNVELSDNMTLIFSHISNNDYQDVTYNSANGKLRLNSYDRNDAREKELKKLEKDLNTVWKAARNSSGNRGNIGSAYDFLTIVNEKINKGFGKGLDKDVSKSLENLKKAGIRDFSIAVNPHKIPKKFASDSIVNRVEGFLDKEEGNVTEANNYEIATNHQADQDGDKITTYLDMPYSVINSSANNMEIVREPLTIPPNKNAFPNVFDSLTGQKGWKRRDNKGNVSQNNPIKYLSEERKSKFIVGSTVKLQGVTTLMNISGMRYKGQPIMKFGNEEGANKDEIRDFQRQFGAITQSILDAWKGVHTDLLNINNIKDYILFGEPVKGVPQLSGKNGFKGIFKIPVDKDNNEISGFERDVFKEYIKESVKVFEETYSALGDSYEGGVSVKPEFFHLKRIHSNLNSLLNNDSSFIYRRLESRIKNNKRMSEQNKKDKLETLSKLFATKNNDGSISIDSRISFDNKMDFIKNTHPQTKALDEIVKKVGDVMIPRDDRGKTDSIQAKIFGLREPSTSAGDDDNIMYDSDTIEVNDREFDRTIFNSYKENFGKDGRKEQLNLVNAARNYGLFRSSVEIYVERLKKELFYYERIGDRDRASDIRRNIEHLEQKNIEKKRQIESIIKEDNTVVLDLKQKNRGDVINNSIHGRDKGKMRHYYTVKNGEYEYEFTLPPGASARVRKSGNYIALFNPIEIRPFKSREWKEGFAQEFATADMGYSLGELFGMNQRQKESLVNKYRGQIEAVKFRLRENMSFVMDEIQTSRLFQNDLYADKANTSDFEIKTLIESIRDDLTEQIGETNERLKERELAEIADFTVKMLLSPRLIPGDITQDGNRYLNNYKVDNQFTKAVMSFLQKNKDGDFQTFYDSFAAVMKTRSKKMLTMSGFALEGAHSTTHYDMGERYKQSVPDRKNKGLDYFHSMMKFMGNPLVSQHITLGKQNPSVEKNTIVHKNKRQKNNNSICIR